MDGQGADQQYFKLRDLEYGTKTPVLGFTNDFNTQHATGRCAIDNFSVYDIIWSIHVSIYIKKIKTT